ncbi:Hypothetical predicted protein, partial [Paramuricea clavata]
CYWFRKILGEALEESEVIFQIKELTWTRLKIHLFLKPKVHQLHLIFPFLLWRQWKEPSILHQNTGIATTITSQDSRAYSDANPIDKLNEFLQSKDVSPIRYPVKVPWEEAVREQTPPHSTHIQRIHHCRKYSLSDPKDKDFQTKSDHHHFDTCDRCESLSLVLNEISGAVAKMSDNNVSVDTKEELEFTVKKAKQDILDGRRICCEILIKMKHDLTSLKL